MDRGRLCGGTRPGAEMTGSVVDVVTNRRRIAAPTIFEISEPTRLSIFAASRG